ncbi:MAG: heme exporter protein CcmB [Saprospiraceae bacterium]
MVFFRTLGILIRKEFLLEFRRWYALGGIVLYVLSMIFVVYLASIQVATSVWNILFWIIVLFASINALVKGFMQESGARHLYYYQLAAPSMILLAKVIYHFALLLVLSFMAFAAYVLVAGNPVRDMPLFMGVLVLGSAGFAVAFTLLSAISARANNSATLMAVLSFPVVLPMLMLLMRLSAIALRLMQDTAWRQDVINLLAIDAILLSLTFLLFPFVWKD